MWNMLKATLDIFNKVTNYRRNQTNACNSTEHQIMQKQRISCICDVSYNYHINHISCTIIIFIIRYQYIDFFKQIIHIVLYPLPSFDCVNEVYVIILNMFVTVIEYLQILFYFSPLGHRQKLIQIYPVISKSSSFCFTSDCPCTSDSHRNYDREREGFYNCLI